MVFGAEGDSMLQRQRFPCRVEGFNPVPEEALDSAQMNLHSGSMMTALLHARGKMDEPGLEFTSVLELMQDIPMEFCKTLEDLKLRHKRPGAYSHSVVMVYHDVAKEFFDKLRRDFNSEVGDVIHDEGKVAVMLNSICMQRNALYLIQKDLVNAMEIFKEVASEGNVAVQEMRRRNYELDMDIRSLIIRLLGRADVQAISDYAEGRAIKENVFGAIEFYQELFKFQEVTLYHLTEKLAPSWFVRQLQDIDCDRDVLSRRGTNSQCPKCQLDIALGVDFYILDMCPHLYCSDCINAWVGDPKNRICPVEGCHKLVSYCTSVTAFNKFKSKNIGPILDSDDLPV